MSALFAMDFTYALAGITDHGARGFQVGVVSVSDTGRRHSTRPQKGLFIDHWPTGRNMAWCPGHDFGLALAIADQFALMLDGEREWDAIKLRAIAWGLCSNEDCDRYVVHVADARAAGEHPKSIREFFARKAVAA